MYMYVYAPFLSSIWWHMYIIYIYVFGQCMFSYYYNMAGMSVSSVLDSEANSQQEQNSGFPFSLF